MKAKFEDVEALPEESSRTFTGDGYLTAPATLARAGVHRYLASELGLDDRKPNDVVGVYRSANELAKALDTFESQTITLDHKWTTAANWRANAVGDVRDVEMHGDVMAGILIIRDAAAIKAIRAGKTQLSNGYVARLVRKPGIHAGANYEFEQVDFQGNHIAIVSAGRCGSQCRIGDGDTTTQEEANMITRTIDGYTIGVQDGFSGEVVDRLISQLHDAQAEIATLKAAPPPKIKFGDCDLDPEGVRALLRQKDAVIETLKKLTADAKVDPRQAHIAQLSDAWRGDSDRATASPGEIAAALIDHIAERDLDPRQAYVQRQRNAWQGEVA